LQVYGGRNDDEFIRRAFARDLLYVAIGRSAYPRLGGGPPTPLTNRTWSVEGGRRAWQTSHAKTGRQQGRDLKFAGTARAHQKQRVAVQGRLNHIDLRRTEGVHSEQLEDRAEVPGFARASRPPPVQPLGQTGAAVCRRARPTPRFGRTAVWHIVQRLIRLAGSSGPPAACGGKMVHVVSFGL
jgi:hypothetical protein